jgi:hypothetical protein
MEIIIDRRIELMIIVQTLCNYWDNLAIKFTNNRLFQCVYKENIMNYFDKYKNHRTIKLYRDLCNDVMDISAFLSMVLCYSNPPEQKLIAGHEDNFGKINNSSFPYEDFIDGLRQFYVDTDFEYFYQGSQNEYRKIINDYGNEIEISNYINMVINYLEIRIKDYDIIIAPLVMGNFGIKIETVEKRILNYSIISPYDCTYLAPET